MYILENLAKERGYFHFWKRVSDGLDPILIIINQDEILIKFFTLNPGSYSESTSTKLLNLFIPNREFVFVCLFILYPLVTRKRRW